MVKGPTAEMATRAVRAKVVKARKAGKAIKGGRVKAKADPERTPMGSVRRRVDHRTAQVADDRLGRLKVFQR